MAGGGGSANGAVRRDELVNRLLALVERAIGEDEALPEAEWESLRTLAAGNPRSLELVEKLQRVIADCMREVSAKKASGVDVLPLRAAIVRFVRETVTKGPAEPGEGGVKA